MTRVIGLLTFLAAATVIDTSVSSVSCTWKALKSVTHKDGFRWDDSEQPFLELLREHLDTQELPLLKQAEGYRVRVARAQLKTSARKAVAGTAQALKDRLPQVISRCRRCPSRGHSRRASA